MASEQLLTNGGTPITASKSTQVKVSAPSQPPQFPSDLPPAALDLAAKLFDLARAGDTSTLSAYLAAGVPKNLTNSSGDTLLMLTSYHGHTDTAKLLLNQGADPNILNEKGQSVIAGAVFKGCDEVVKVLFEGGADVKIGHPNAVDCARMFKREEMLRLFGAEVGEGVEIRVDDAPRG
ncbi:ankyrin [Lojkania enalia]|uniref:Ankyrin n=1 Tax=Lojkania enalia TaxID=147567 RepID=A0A9P4N1M0_9PLEO|nr:ankyrin [Didymosphaeria enalia]